MPRSNRYGLDPNYLADFLGASNADLESDTALRAYPEDHEQNHLVTA
jgi:hypothetical protein